MAYREFFSADEAEEWAWKYYADFLNMKPESELYQLIFAYTGSWYKGLNRLLRSCPPLGTLEFERLNFGDFVDEKRVILEIYNVLQQYHLPEDIVVYRFTHLRDVIKMVEDPILRKGLHFSDKAFFSTTLVKEMLEPFGREHGCNCVLKLHLPKGLHGAYVSLKSDTSQLDEQEFLLPPNTKIEIIKVHCFTYPVQIDCIAILD